MKDNSKIVERIAKVLAKAKNNPSEEECQSALALAQKLMAEYNIELSDVEGMARMRRKRQVTQDGALKQKRYEWWMKSLAPIIADNFRCKCFLDIDVDSWRTATFVGFKEDVSIANLAFTQTVDVIWFLQRKFFLKIRKEYKKETGVKLNAWELKGRVNTYIAGFLKGLKEKLEEQRASNVYALVLVVPQEVEEEFKLKKLHKGDKTSAEMAKDADAFDAGFKDGQKHTIKHGFIDERLPEIEQVRKFWENHGEYGSSLDACRDARDNGGFKQVSLKDMVDLYKEMFGGETLGLVQGTGS